MPMAFCMAIALCMPICAGMTPLGMTPLCIGMPLCICCIAFCCMAFGGIIGMVL